MPMLFPKPLRPKKKSKGPTLHGVPVTISELRNYILVRDRACVAWHMDAMHECRGPFSVPHEPTRLTHLQLAHVPEAGQNALGRKPPDDELHTVAECAAANVFPGPSAALRDFERRWIAEHEPRG